MMTGVRSSAKEVGLLYLLQRLLEAKPHLCTCGYQQGPGEVTQ